MTIAVRALLALLLLGALLWAVAYRQSQSPTPTGHPTRTIDFDIDYGGSLKSLIKRSPIIVRVVARGVEEPGEPFDDGSGTSQNSQGFEVVRSLRGSFATGDTFKVSRLDISEELRSQGYQTNDPIVPPFVDGATYVLMLQPVPGDGAAPLHLTGYLSGALIREGEVLRTTYQGTDVPRVVKRLNQLSWRDFKALVRETG